MCKRVSLVSANFVGAGDDARNVNGFLLLMWKDRHTREEQEATDSTLLFRLCV